MSEWTPVEIRPEIHTTRQYTYVGRKTRLRHKLGLEASIFVADRRFLNDRNKYMPHQGARECARRAAR